VIFIVLFTFSYLLISSGTDHYRKCDSPNHISKYRGIGVGVNRTFSRIIEKPHDDFPVIVTPDAYNISLMMEEGAFLHPKVSKLPKTTNIFWAWLNFVINDMVLVAPSGNSSDTLFSGTGITEIERSAYVLDHEGNRQQINLETPYIDASHIYGRDAATASSLRRLDGTGKLKTMDAPGQSADDTSMLPYDNITGLFLGVDERVNQNVIVSALYVLFVREHNTWCERLKAEMDYLTENEVYNMARHLVIAEIQVITYREAIPLLLGISEIDPGVCFTHHTNDGDHTSITNEFAVAASKIGNSMVTDELEVRDPTAGSFTLVSPISLLEPAASFIWEHGAGAVLLGASKQKSRYRDLSIADVVRQYTAAQDISRGRDHQLPSYQQFYSHFTKHANLKCLDYAYNTSLCDSIADLYGFPDSMVDLYVGLLAEKRTGGSLLGIVGTKLFKYMFSHVKHNDHYFYLWDRVIKAHISEIHGMRLSKIILRNTDIVPSNLRPNSEASVFIL
jgi:hypothetical protein